jgi:hypothetical protein
MSNRKQVYDEQLKPLLQQLAATCRAHSMSFVSVFDVTDPDSDEAEYAVSGNFARPVPQRLLQVLAVMRSATDEEEAAHAVSGTASLITPTQDKLS